MKNNTRTQKTIKTLRELGFHVANVEKWNHHAGIRQDAFGIVDLLAINPNTTLGVQSTSKGALLDHRTKLRQAEATSWWCTGPRFLLLVGWDQRVRGGKWTGFWELAVMSEDGDVDFRNIKPEAIAMLSEYDHAWEDAHHAV